MVSFSLSVEKGEKGRRSGRGCLGQREVIESLKQIKVEKEEEMKGGTWEKPSVVKKDQGGNPSSRKGQVRWGGKAMGMKERRESRPWGRTGGL